MSKATQHIKLIVGPIIMQQLPLALQNGFNPTTAVGAQLDIIGKYVGVTRNGFGPAGAITLNDTDFRTLIQLAIVDNNNNGTLASIQTLLHTYFDNEIFVFDNQDMQVSYFINASGTSLDLAILFVTEGLLPKTLGVQLASVIYSVNVLSFFGMASYSAPPPTYLTFPNVTPLNSYASYQTNRPMLTYADALTAQS